MAHFKSAMGAYALAAFGLPCLLAALAARFPPRPSAPAPALPPKARPMDWRLRAIGAIIFAILWIGLVPKPPLDAPPDPMDDGMRLAAVQAVDDGKVPYKDVFLLYGPLSQVILPKLAFALWGKTALALRLLDWGLSMAPPLMLALWAAWGLRRRYGLWLLLYAAASRGTFLIPMRIFFPLASLAFFTGALRWDGRWRRSAAIVSGMFAVLSGLYSWEGGAFVMMTFLVYFAMTAKTEKRALGAFATGTALLALPLALWLTVHRAWPAFIVNAWQAASPYAGLTAKPTPPVQWHGVWLWWWLPVPLYALVLGGCFYRVFRGTLRAADHAIFLCALSGFFFFFVALGRSDIDHWWKATAPFWVLMLFLIERLATRPRLAGLIGLVYVMANGASPVPTLMNGVDKFALLPVPAPATQTPNAPLQRLGRLPVSSQAVEPLRAMLDHVEGRVPAGAPVFFFGNNALYYFLGPFRNPTPYNLEADMVSPAMIATAIAALERSPGAYVVVRDRRGAWTEYAYLRPLAAYLRAHYVVVERWGDTMLLKRWITGGSHPR